MNDRNEASRRGFLHSLGAASALGLLAPEGAVHGAISNWSLPFPSAPRGLAERPDDFGFAPGLVYLQTGSLGPTPRPVMERAFAAWRELQLDPLLYGYELARPALEEVRAKGARFVGCETNDLVLTSSTTVGMNAVAQGIAFRAGDRVLTTDQEHEGGRACWDWVARRHAVVIDVVPIPPGESDPQAIVDRFAARIGPRTRVLSFSHILGFSGLRMPAAELSALAHSRGCLAVADGAQAIGAIAVDLKRLGCDAYASSGHKWLLGPPGTGLLHLAGHGSDIDPISLQSGREVYSHSTGIGNIPGVLGLGAAFDYVERIGIGKIEAWNLALRNRLYDALPSIPGLRMLSPPPGPLASPLLSFELPAELPAFAFRRMLVDRYRIETKAIPSRWVNGIRLSTHLFNSECDVDAVIEALKIELG